MRLHAHRDHADYHPVAMHAKILLDGQELDLCIHADEEAGTVERARRDASGRLLLIGDQVATETLHGVVRIDIPPEYQALLRLFPAGPATDSIATE